VKDEKDALLLRAETPGVPKENLKVLVQDGLLTISGEESKQKKEEGWEMMEFGTFEHSWTLPQTVDADNLTANYNHGVLHIRLPKRALPESRRIKIT
jgi:HSP20 family protein